MGDNGVHDAQEAGEAGPPSIPAMPVVPGSRLNSGPELLVEYGLRHSLGWQDHRKAGPSFVIVRLRELGPVTVTARFPLTDQGWESAWRTLSDLDPGAAAAVAAKLSEVQGRRSNEAALAVLDADTTRCLPRVTYTGGSTESLLTLGQTYDLRFLGDRILICPAASSTAVVELPYDDVETLEVSGKSPGQPLPVILGLGLGGAVLGAIIFRWPGLFFGAVIFATIGAIATGGIARIETIVRLRSRNAEFFFMNTAKTPDVVRIELSAPLRAIDVARTARQNDSSDSPSRTSDSIPDQLTKLASLLADGVLSREEFDNLKARLIGQP